MNILKFQFGMRGNLEREYYSRIYSVPLHIFEHFHVVYTELLCV